MANVEMSPNPKRVKVFIGSDGKIYEGGAEENLGTNLGTAPGTDRIQEEDKKVKKNKDK